ncbi:hypothetical protein BU15DRAFT_45142, partial [Melanogaster broomeanus]
LLLFNKQQLRKENLLVRVLGSCKTMANASVICTDKTGTLTENTMNIVQLHQHPCEVRAQARS